jgi:hypothetical protein
LDTNNALTAFCRDGGDVRKFDFIYSSMFSVEVGPGPQLIEQISTLLADEGLCVLGVRFTDQFTPISILKYLIPYMHHCKLIDYYDWDLEVSLNNEDDRTALFVFQRIAENNPVLMNFDNELGKMLDVAYKGYLWQVVQKSAATSSLSKSELIQYYENSRSWKLTSPLRCIAKKGRRIKEFLKNAKKE